MVRSENKVLNMGKDSKIFKSAILFYLVDSLSTKLVSITTVLK